MEGAVLRVRPKAMTAAVILAGLFPLLIGEGTGSEIMQRLAAPMVGKGNCYDNAAVETFFKSLKAEVLWRQTWPTRRQAETAIFQYINGFYNPRRRHSYLGGISPLAFEAKVA